MIILKTKQQIEQIINNGKILRAAVNKAAQYSAVGTTTKQIDQIIKDYILTQQAIPTFKGYGETFYRKGFPAASCISVNDTLVHGIPDDTKIKKGDLISIDIGVTKNGCVADSCFSYIVGEPTSLEHQNLLNSSLEITMHGISLLKEGLRIYDLASAIYDKANQLGFTTMKDLYGHGTGVDLHEAPTIPFTKHPYSEPIPNIKLKENMVITIEPVVCLPSAGDSYLELNDGWTLKTRDGSWSSQFEHTVLITKTGYEILTEPFSDKLIY